MKYRKKPVVIEAFQWTGGPDQTEDPEWIVEAIEKRDAWFRHHPQRGTLLVIHTLEGDMEAQPGDFVIKGIKGEIYPCKADIFQATYENVE